MSKSLLREYELCVLGQALTFPDVGKKIALLPDDLMSYPDTAELHKAIKEVANVGHTPDIQSVGMYVNDFGIIAEATRVGSITSVGYDEKIQVVLEWRKRRILKQRIQDVANRIYDVDSNVDQLLSSITTIDFGENGDTDNVKMSDAVIDLLGSIEHGNENRMMTGIAGLDNVTGGFRPGQLIYIGARPGVGKSALALYIATNVALKYGRVLYISLEMTPEEIASRTMATESGMDMERFVNGNLDADDWQKAWATATNVSAIPLEVNNKAYTPMAIRQVASRMMCEKNGLRMIVVDYLQLMHPDEKHKSKTEDVTEISQTLKQIAMELKVPIMALTQFNRMSEADGKKNKPTMAQARDSGSIEQDANIFLTLYAPEEPPPNNFAADCFAKCKQRGTEFQVLTVEKNRNGRTGIVSLEFEKSKMRFRTLIKDR